MKHAVTIGISGGTGSGKTTLARKLKDSFEEDVVLLCQDYYYRSFNHLTFKEREKLNYDHPDAFETSLLVDHIKRLKAFETIERPVYSFTEHRRLDEKVTVEARRVILLEGILIFENSELRELMDIKVFAMSVGTVLFDKQVCQREPSPLTILLSLDESEKMYLLFCIIYVSNASFADLFFPHFYGRIPRISQIRLCFIILILYNLYR